jgi:hypothetical protein
MGKKSTPYLGHFRNISSFLIKGGSFVFRNSPLEIKASTVKNI